MAPEARDPADLMSVPTLIHGRTWEEMTPGFTFRTTGRTITEADLISFITLVGVNEPLFFDARFRPRPRLQRTPRPGNDDVLVCRGSGDPGRLDPRHRPCVPPHRSRHQGTGVRGRHHHGARRGHRAAGRVHRQPRRRHHPQHGLQPTRRRRDGLLPGPAHQGGRRQCMT